MLSHLRLLVTEVQPAIDPDVIRYAAMLTRMREAATTKAPHLHVAPDKQVLIASRVGGRRRRSAAVNAPAKASNDSEVRFLALLPYGRGSDRQRDIRSARLMLRSRVDAHFQPAGVSVIVGCDAVCGQTTRRVAAYAKDFGADLIVVGRQGTESHGLSRLATAAPASTLFVPPGWAPVMRHILVAVDFGQSALASVQAAIRLARHFSPAKCLLLHVDRQETRGGDGDVAPFRSRELMAKFDQLLGGVESHGVKLKPMLVKAQFVERAIARVAAEQAADLVVLGTRGRTQIGRGLFPSVTLATLREYGGAVLAEKMAGPPLGLRDSVRQWGGTDGPLFS